MTVDVEDYFHVAAFNRVITPTTGPTGPRGWRLIRSACWSYLPSIKFRLLFFILGWVAERYPELVRQIAAAGHEIASHGYSHQLIYRQTPEVFRAETLKSKQILEDITGTAVTGIERPATPSPASRFGRWIFWASWVLPGTPVFSPPATTITAFPAAPKSLIC